MTRNVKEWCEPQYCYRGKTAGHNILLLVKDLQKMAIWWRMLGEICFKWKKLCDYSRKVKGETQLFQRLPISHFFVALIILGFRSVFFSFLFFFSFAFETKGLIIAFCFSLFFVLFLFCFFLWKTIWRLRCNHKAN